MPVLGAPASPDTSRQVVPYQEQEPARHRSAEAARNRLSGFQLGYRDAVEAGRDPHDAVKAGRDGRDAAEAGRDPHDAAEAGRGRPGGTPHAGEENSR
jgi:hypothetical protein